VTSYGDTSAWANSQYTYRVTAKNSVGNSVYSNEAALTTTAAEISINNVNKVEGNGKGNTTFNFTVTLSRPSSQTVTVSYATPNGTATTSGGDYIATNGTLTFTPGQSSKIISVQVKRDKVKETNETFFVDLTNVANALTKKSRGIGTIINDD
jgi:fibronectin-binding autotransporter adhesin